MNAAGRSRPKLTSTMTSVPPAIGKASGRSAFIASASSRDCGSRTSIADQLLYLRRGAANCAQQGPGAEHEMRIRRRLLGRVADTADAGNEEHSGGHVPREHRGIVAGAAPEACRLVAELFTGGRECRHLVLMHWRRRHPGQDLGLGGAALLLANRLQPLAEAGDDTTNDGLFEVTNLEREERFARDDVDASRLEVHRAEVGDRVGVYLMHQL